MARGGRRRRSRLLEQNYQVASAEVPIMGTQSAEPQITLPEVESANQTNESVPWVEEQANNHVNNPSSYASLVDPDEGTDVQFILAEISDGRKIAKIEKGDVEAEIEYWNNAVLCSVLGANPPFEVIHGYVKRIWATYEIDKLIQVRKLIQVIQWVFLVRFVMPRIR